MEKVVPYEHRGARYRNLTIQSQSEAEEAAAIYRAECDVWLKKILASKLLEAASVYAVDISVEEFNRLLRCRIK
jgi:hypothetical protein